MQYLKQLRLVAARRLMITSNSNVESVANEVGIFECIAVQPRIYSHVGKPPRRDVLTASHRNLLRHVLLRGGLAKILF